MLAMEPYHNNSRDCKMTESSLNDNTPPISINVLAQYLKDLSFERALAPTSLPNRDLSPQIEVAINVQAHNVEKETFAVELQITAKAHHEKETLFHAELLYGGAFQLQNLPESQHAAFLFIEAPRLLFPFARQILASATRDGGFPPLYLEPIDFAQLYQARLAAANTDSPRPPLN